mgnify:CR=1 FL=1
MRTRMGALFALFLALGSSGVAVARDVEVPLHWRRDQVRQIWIDGEARAIELQGAEFRAKAGEVDLPWVRVAVPITNGESPVSWSWDASATEPLSGLVATAAPLDRPEQEGGPQLMSLRLDPSDGRRPEAPVVFSGIERERGVSRAVFWVCPFELRAEDAALAWTPSGVLRIRLQIEPAAVAPSQAAASRASRPLRPLEARPASASSTKLDLRGTVATNPTPTPEGVPFEYLIITTDALAASWTPMAAWKTRSGTPAAIQTVEWIYENYPQGIDAPEKIRLFLRDAYDYWGARWVLMGGDPSIVPIRYAHSWAFNPRSGGTDVSCDYYYACLDGDWNANGNAAFGEGTFGQTNRIHDQTDLIPELMVGRVSARTPSDVTAYWSKLQRYVTNPRRDSYLKDVVTMGEVLFHREWQLGECDDCAACPGNPVCANADGALDCIRMIDSVRVNERGGFFEFSELYERDYWWVDRGRPAAQPLNFTSVMSHLEAGAHVVHQVGHGDRDRWSIGAERIVSSNLFRLRNGDSGKITAFCYVVNCNSAAVEYDCAGEAWILNPTGGGLAYIGSTNVDFPLAAARHQNKFFRTWPGDGNVTLGEAHYAAVAAAATVVGNADSNLRFLTYSLIFLGDPSLRPWTSIPDLLTVEHPTTLALGSGAAEVTVEASGTPVEGALVCFHKSGDAFATALTDVNGVASVEFAPSTVGALQVTVTHRDGVPYQGTAQVVESTDGFLALDALTIDDATDGLAGTLGNGNGKIEVGETTFLGVTFSNNGAGAANAAEAALEIGEVPGDAVVIELLDGGAALGSVAAGASGTSARAFQLSVRENDPPAAFDDLVLVPAEIVWSSSAGTTRQPIVLEIVRPDLVVFRGDPVNETDSGTPPAPADNFAWSFEFMNRGAGDATHVRARLEPELPSAVTFRRQSTGLTSAATDEHAETTAPFAFTINSVTNLRFDLLLEDTLTTPARLLWRRGVDMAGPTAPDSVGAIGTPDAIRIGWSQVTPAGRDDLSGYRVERSGAIDGAYAPIGVGILGRTRSVTDEQLPPLTAYWYRVAAVDSSGNRSEFTEPILVTTAVGSLDGWPAFLDDQPEEFGAPTVENLNASGGYEVLTPGDVLYVFEANGGDYVDGDGSLSTRGKFFSPSVGQRVWGKPAVADIDNDGMPEVVCIARNGHQAGNQPAASLLIFEHDGALKASVPLANATIVSSPAIGNVDSDEDLEIVFLGSRSVWGFNGDGSPIRPGTNGEILSLGANAFFLYGSIALSNFDGDSQDELVFTTRTELDSSPAKLYIINAENGSSISTRFPYSYAGGGAPQEISNSSPAIAHLENVGTPATPEILVTTKYGIWCIDPLRASNPLLWYARSTFNAAALPVNDIDINPSPALGDLDGDGDLDVAYGWSRGRLYVRDALTGTPLPEYQSGANPFLEVGAANTQMGSPILGDLDGDLRPEIIVGDLSGRVYAIRPDGSMMPGFPYFVGGRVTAGLAVWDIDRDGHPNLVIQAHQVTQVTTLDFPAGVFNENDPIAFPWPQFRHDARNTGSFPNPIMTPVAVQAPMVRAAGAYDVEIEWETGHPFQVFVVERRASHVEDWSEVGSYSPEETRVGPGRYLSRDVVPSTGLWFYRIVAIDIHGEPSLSGESQVTVTATPAAFRLYAASPNPFRPSTRLDLELPSAMQASVRVYDASGRVLATLADRSLNAGRHTLVWDGRDDSGRDVGSGLYFVEARLADGRRERQKVVRLD